MKSSKLNAIVEVVLSKLNNMSIYNNWRYYDCQGVNKCGLPIVKRNNNEDCRYYAESAKIRGVLHNLRLEGWPMPIM